MKSDAIGLAGWIVICLGAGMIGAQFEPGPWYGQLSRPVWTPPDAVFGPVWTVLYCTMGVAAWMVWRKRRVRSVRVPLAAFFAQLGLNALWSYLFFGLHSPGWALIELCTLWAAVVLSALLFWRTSAVAGILMVPYLLWTSFAAVLNHAIWKLNA